MRMVIIVLFVDGLNRMKDGMEIKCPECGSNRVKVNKKKKFMQCKCGHRWSPGFEDLGEFQWSQSHRSD